MATDKVYQYLTAFLAGEMRKSYPKFDVGLGYGAKDSKPNAINTPKRDGTRSNRRECEYCVDLSEVEVLEEA